MFKLANLGCPKFCTRRNACRTGITLVLLAVVAWQWGKVVTIHGKAVLAQYLIAQSWQEALAAPDTPLDSHKPWHWADTWPVARLQWIGKATDAGGVARADLLVLAGSSGSSLAFGPGHMDGTALPGQGASVISGHRDTHFRFLKNVRIGSSLQIQTIDGTWIGYRIIAIDVVDAGLEPLYINTQSMDIWLITCYPFDAVQPGGPLRYVVRAQPATSQPGEEKNANIRL